MNTAFVLAEFIGVEIKTNGVLIYRRGKIYPLIVTKLDWFVKLMKGWSLGIVGVDGKGWCSYKDEKNFFANWLVISEGKYKVEIKKIKGGE
jgi:hypothetical protein